MFVISLLLLSACTLAGNAKGRGWDLSKPADTPSVPVAQMPQQQPNVLSGAVIYQQKCEPCHGSTGAGDGPSASGIRAQGKQVSSLIDPSKTRVAKPIDWFNVVSKGRIQNLMPPFAGSLNAQERWDVLAYVWALGAPAATLEQGRAIFAEQCAGCHTNPALLTPPIRLMNRTLAETTNTLSNGPHAELKLSAAQRDTLADFVRSLGYAHADVTALRASALQGDGSISYFARNQTLGAAPVSGLEVTLRAYDASSEVLTRTSVLDAQGVVRFTGLPRKAGLFYEPEVTYNGARFFAPPLQLSGTLPVSAVLPVFEVGNDPRAVAISEWHYFVQQARDSELSIVELFIFENNSDRAFISKPGQSLNLTVPAEAKNLRFDGPGLGARFIREGNTLIDRDALLPGPNASSVTMLYELPYREGAELRREHNYPVQQWDAILPDGPLRVGGLNDRGLQNTTGGSVRIYTGAPMAQAGTATFTLMGRPRGVALPGSDSTSMLIAALLLAAAVGALVFVLMRHRVRTDDMA